MKKMIIMLLLSPAAFAATCFNPGHYEGYGLFKDAQGQKGSYEIKVDAKSATEVRSEFKWPKEIGGGQNEVILNYEVKGNQLFVNGTPNPSGSAACRLGTTSLNLTADKMAVKEEWLVTGNYLIISGEKNVAGKVIQYIELLVRQ